MFEKHRNNRPEQDQSKPAQDNFTAVSGTPANSGRAAVIGPGISIDGDISGDENLLIEGSVKGKIRLAAHQVEVGKSGHVNADVTAKVIRIAGEVRGDLNGTEKVVILSSGNVHGNIVAPRMTLEDGAIFKGSIDMDPGEPAKAKASKPTTDKVEKAAEKPAVSGKAIATDKTKEGSAYSLNGG